MKTHSAAPSAWGLILALILFMGAGCAPVISEEVRRQAEPPLEFENLLADPAASQGRMVIFSGAILEAVNLSQGTRLMILQRPTGPSGRPLLTDESHGRFLAEVDRYLDVAVFASGREVTVAGRVTGVRPLPLGEIEYPYPVIEVKEIHLWRPRVQTEIGFGFGYRQTISGP